MPARWAAIMPAIMPARWAAIMPLYTPGRVPLYTPGPCIHPAACPCIHLAACPFQSEMSFLDLPSGGRAGGRLEMPTDNPRRSIPWLNDFRADFCNLSKVTESPTFNTMEPGRIAKKAFCNAFCAALKGPAGDESIPAAKESIAAAFLEASDVVNIFEKEIEALWWEIVEHENNTGVVEVELEKVAETVDTEKEKEGAAALVKTLDTNTIDQFLKDIANDDSRSDEVGQFSKDIANTLSNNNIGPEGAAASAKEEKEKKEKKEKKAMKVKKEKKK